MRSRIFLRTSYQKKILTRTEVKIFLSHFLMQLEGKSAHKKCAMTFARERRIFFNWILKEKLYHAHSYQITPQCIELLKEKWINSSLFRDYTMWADDLVKYPLDFLTRDRICMRKWMQQQNHSLKLDSSSHRKVYHCEFNKRISSTLSHSMESQLENELWTIYFFNNILHSDTFSHNVRWWGGIVGGRWERNDFFVACTFLCVWFMLYR